MPFPHIVESVYDPDLLFQRPELIMFLAYWNAKRGGRPFPCRDDFVPRELLSVLPSVHMYDVLDPPGGATDKGKQFRVRLIGTALSNFFPKMDMRGIYIVDWPRPMFERVQQHLLTVLKRRSPVRVSNQSTSIPGQEFQGSEACYAPLSSNGDDIDIIIAVSILLLEQPAIK